MPDVLRIAPEVQQAIHERGPVVALETTLVAHGFPPGVGVEVGLAAEARVRAEGAVPATVGVLDGAVVVGLTEEELGCFGEAGAEARKAGPRDLAACAVQGALGATTVGGTLAVCRAAGIRFMGTGGLGGVHRGFAERPDISADLTELARTEVLVVASGLKSLLDVPASAEALETCRASTRPAAARRSRHGSTPPRRRLGSPAGTGSSVAAAFCSPGRPTTAWTTSSRCSKKRSQRRARRESTARRLRRSYLRACTSEAAGGRRRRTRRSCSPTRSSPPGLPLPRWLARSPRRGPSRKVVSGRRPRRTGRGSRCGAPCFRRRRCSPRPRRSRGRRSCPRGSS